MLDPAQNSQWLIHIVAPINISLRNVYATRKTTFAIFKHREESRKYELRGQFVVKHCLGCLIYLVNRNKTEKNIVKNLD